MIKNNGKVTTMKQQISNKKNQTGIGLMEVMVSLLLLAVSVLGFIALQTRSAEATDESLVRTSALSIMGDLADKVRFNVGALSEYQTNLETYDTGFNGTTAPSKPKSCGLGGASIVSGTAPNATVTASSLCNATQQAKLDSYLAVKHAYENGFRLRMADCPQKSTGGDEVKAKCLIVAWKETTATVGTGASDCVKADAGYNTNAHCMIMELL